MIREKFSQKYIPGMRTIKTATAVLINLLIFEILGFKNAFYACIASVVCMQQTVEETVKAGKSRLIGTSVAAVIGLVAFYIGEWLSNPAIYLFLIPIGIIFIIQICVLLKCASSASISCVVYISILTSHRIAGDNSTYPLSRIIETFIGVAVATLVNKYISTKYFKLFKLRKYINKDSNKQ